MYNYNIRLKLEVSANRIETVEYITISAVSLTRY